MKNKIITKKALRKAKRLYLKKKKFLLKRKRVLLKKEKKRIRNLLKTDLKIVIYNIQGRKIRVNLLKAFFIGTKFNLRFVIDGEEILYRADYFFFDKRQIYLRLIRDDKFIDDAYRIYYILWNTCEEFLEGSTMLNFLNKIEKILINKTYRSRLKEKRKKRNERKAQAQKTN
jgi:hypothetical protein